VFHGRGVETLYQDADAPHKNKDGNKILTPPDEFYLGGVLCFMPSCPQPFGWRVVIYLNKPTILDNCFEPPTT